MNKLGFYIQVSRGVHDYINSLQPPVILLHAWDQGLLEEIRRYRSPNSFVIGRMDYIGQFADKRAIDQDLVNQWLDHSDPEGRGRDFAQHILDDNMQLARKKLNDRLLVDAWMSLNECVPGPGSGDYQRGNPEKRAEIERRLQAYDAFQIGFRTKLAEHGIEAVAFNFGAGNFGTAEHYTKWFPRTLQAYRYLGFHEYGWPAMSKHLDPAAESSAGTYRQIMTGIRQEYGNQHEIIITEAGLARMYRHPENPPGDVGWLYAGDPVSAEKYGQSLVWYNDHLCLDSYVKGACLYQVGHGGDWESFRHIGQDNQGQPLHLMSLIGGLRDRPLPDAQATPSPAVAPSPQPPPKIIHTPAPAQPLHPLPASPPATSEIRQARERVGIDANNPLAGPHPAPQVADATVIAATGVGWVRLNFVRGPWGSVEDPGWEQTFRQIVNGFRSRGLKIYGLINYEALDAADIDQMRTPPPEGAFKHPWIDRYVETFASIVRRFHNDVAAWESFNEPDDWHGAKEDWPHKNLVHPGWFAVILERVYNKVKFDLGLEQVKLVSGPVQGLHINDNAGAEYLRRTYQEGKQRFNWGKFGKAFPFDGVGYHLYIEEGAKEWGQQAQLVPAKYTHYLQGLKNVIQSEEGKRKPLYISEAGWHSNGDQDEFQSRNVALGLDLLLKDPWVALAVWFCTQDFDESPTMPKYYGVYRRTGVSALDRKPAFTALQTFCAREWRGLPPPPGLAPAKPAPLAPQPPAPQPPAPQPDVAGPQPVFRVRYGAMPPTATNQQVIEAFKQASLRMGLGNWDLMTKAGLKLGDLARDQATRQSLYTGPGLDQLSQLSQEERYYIRQALPDDVSFDILDQEAFLGRQLALVQAALALPEDLHFALPDAPTPAQRRVAAVWNRFGFLLIQIADALGLEVDVVTAVTAAARGRPGLDSAGRLVVSFQVDHFYAAWGSEHAADFARHFSFDPAQPGQKQLLRTGPEAAWQEVHRSYDSEWAALQLALTMDRDAALRATEMGFPRLPGRGHADLGYDSAQAMFDAFASSERFQILALFDSIAGPFAESAAVQALADRDPTALAPLSEYLVDWLVG